MASQRRFPSVAVIAALLSGCGGSGAPSTNAVSTVPTASAPAPSPAPAPVQTSSGNGCSLRERQDWAAAQLREWYLFPETLPTTLDPSLYGSVQSYLDALTATARGQRRDRFFTYLASIADENAFFNSGSSAGFGIRLSSAASTGRTMVVEAFEGAPALAVGIDRGTEILAVGTTPDNLRSVSSIIAAEGSGGVSNALGPNTTGTTRTLQITDAARGTRTVTISKSDFELLPVSTRYGAQVIDDGGRRVGYVNLRTFISTANPALRQAFADFRQQGITSFIVDLRYNGGGLVSIAELVSDLMGGARSTSEVSSFTTFRSEKSSNNKVKNFAPQPESVAPVRVAFIGTGSSASASELVINAAIPYLHANAALIGANTDGKPVGQIGLDRAQCDDRLRVVAFATQNAARRGDYYDGLAGTVEASCQAADDFSRPLGDPLEASTRQALSYLRGESCTPISTGQQSQSVRSRAELLVPAAPSAAQREVTGLF